MIMSSVVLLLISDSIISEAIIAASVDDVPRRTAKPLIHR
jgi:hypothetical protein